MSIFHFKRFDVANERSSMKVNTDGVLLGAIVGLDGRESAVLDVGTGTGTVALMLSQRLCDLGAGQFRIVGLDIDAPSVDEANANFVLSPWQDHLEARLEPLQSYMPPNGLDLIVSNPPYFDNSLQASGERRNAARHTEVVAGVAESLSYRDLVLFADRHLNPDGRLALILPSDQEKALLRFAASYSLCPLRLTRVRTTPRKAPSRIIVEFARVRRQAQEGLVTIQDGGAYTEQYLEIMHDFYLFA